MRNGSQSLMGLYAVLAVPFLLNDIANIFVTDYRVWIGIDYTFVKALPIVILVWAAARGMVRPEDLGLQRLTPALFVFYALGMSVAGILLDTWGLAFFESLAPGGKLGSVPVMEGTALGAVDATIGLFFVGVVEEIIFRGLAWTAIMRATGAPGVAVGLSALVFGAIHWSLGPAAVANAAVIGGVFSLCMWRTGSVYPLIIAHCIVDVLYFGGA